MNLPRLTPLQFWLTSHTPPSPEFIIAKMDADAFYMAMLMGTFVPLGFVYGGINTAINLHRLKKRLNALFNNSVDIVKTEGKLTEKSKRSVSSGDTSSTEYKISYEFQLGSENEGQFATKTVLVSSTIYNQLPEIAGSFSVIYSKQDIMFNFPEIQAEKLRNAPLRGLILVALGCAAYIFMFIFMMISSAGSESVPESSRMAVAIASVFIFVVGCPAIGWRVSKAPTIAKQWLGETVIKNNQAERI